MPPFNKTLVSSYKTPSSPYKPADFNEDLALKRCIQRPEEGAPCFEWRRFGECKEPQLQNIHLADADQKNFGLTDVADIIGSALTDLLHARKAEDIFNSDNQHFVASITELVGQRIAAQLQNETPLKLRELHLLIEQTLIEHDAHDVARSLVARRNLNRGLSNSEAQSAKIRLIRRNGQLVPWDANKIEIAVRKAFLSQHQDSSPAVAVAAAITARALKRGEPVLDLESVQDMVQEELMRSGHYKIAEAYILYRAQHKHLRQLAELEEDEDVRQDVNILLHSEQDAADTTFWNPLELRARIEFASIGLDLCLDINAIEKELRRSLYSEMTAEQLRKTIILNAKSLIERDADFARFAGRILVSYIYEEALGWNLLKEGIGGLRHHHSKGFKKYLKRGVKIGRLSPELLDYDIDQLAAAIDPLADFEFDYLGISTLYDRYLIVDKTGKDARRIEPPQFFWMRVAMGLFLKESENREARTLELYKLYKSRRFCSSTPTLFNAGTPHSQLSSCYLYKVDDSLESIMNRGIAENAFLSKWAGGLGGSWTCVRGTGSHIEGTNGESQGVIPFLKLHNDQLVAVNQGGKRRGSGCAYLETWHNDILDFLELRRGTGDERRRTHDMNTANWIPDLFMQRMEQRENWTLFRANEVPELHECYGRAFKQKYVEYEAMAARGEIWHQSIPAIDLWKAMLRMLFETGHPWITFKDPCNVRSPQSHAGVIHSSNLCTEITLNTSEDETAVCNLGSVVLDNHLNAEGELDLPKLEATIRIAIRALDNVIDLNLYPTEAAKTSNHRHRPIGLGVMGLQNALFSKNIPFASEAAVEFNDTFTEAVAYFAYAASSDLAAERGAYSSYEGSKWSEGLLPPDTLELLEQERGEALEVPRGGRMDWDALREKIKTQGMRNSNITAIAPTATISNIMGTSPCIEPSYKNFYVKSNLSGDFVVLNAALIKDLKTHNLWGREMLDALKYFDGELQNIDAIPENLKRKYATAFGIEHTWLIRAAARRQKWLDQSQSVNLFLGAPDLKTLSHMYRSAWRQGLKTTYYLRTLGASNIEKATISVKKEIRGAVGLSDTPAPAALPEGAPAPEPISSDAPAKPAPNSEAQNCQLNALINGEECESCQ